jgi:uncharacterized protein (TIGR03083 family)
VSAFSAERNIEVFLDEAARLVDAVATGPSDAPVPGCPGWDLTGLARHVGNVYSWVTVVATTRQPGSGGRAPKEPAEAQAFLRQAIEPLAAALRALQPDEPCWNFTGGPQVGAFWPRRMAQETAVHRWDAERAIGRPASITPDLAADGIDEVLSVMVGRWLSRDEIPSERIDVGGALALVCTDTPASWTVLTDGGRYRVRPGSDGAAVTVRGPAEAVLLLLWNRLGLDDPAVQVDGDRGPLERWSAIARG